MDVQWFVTGILVGFFIGGLTWAVLGIYHSERGK